MAKILFKPLKDIPDSAVQNLGFQCVYSFGILLIPNTSIGVRRLHDTEKSGWRLLWLLTIIGFLYVIYLYVQPSDKTPNKYGDPPVSSKKNDFAEGARFTREK